MGRSEHISRLILDRSDVDTKSVARDRFCSNLAVHGTHRQTTIFSTRSSVAANKPRDAFVQYAVAYLTPVISRPSHTRVTVPNVIVLESNGIRAGTEIRLKNWAPRVSPFKVTQGH